jgi:undecaprenyl-phosphate 4-deoxy-4-formamido-L-arabinose transferase
VGDEECFEISVVIPVFNGASSVADVVARIREVFNDCSHEIVLVDDGSMDHSAKICRDLAHRDAKRVHFVELSRNFGEHSAVLAGLARSRGQYVAVLDDDGQNPPEELPRMLGELKRSELDVIYGKYSERKHHWFRQLGSRFNDRVANIMLRKPPELYLSSFKVMNRFIVNEIIKYSGPFPYIDGLICRTSNRLGQIDVAHAPRIAGRSNYSLVRLVRLWLNMFLGFSIVPLRFASIVGLLTAASSLIWLSTASDLQQPSGWLNRMLLSNLRCENRLIAQGAKLPFGSSIFAIAKRQVTLPLGGSVL